MDHGRFDRLSAALGSATSRRAGVKAALALLVGSSAEPIAAARHERGAHGDRKNRAGGGKRRPAVEGPCGDGSPEDNSCNKHAQCCTGYCRKGTNGKPGRCRYVRVDGDCSRGQWCNPGLTCANGICSRGGSQCTAATCPNGCCRNGECTSGTSDAACGTGGESCAACSGATPVCASGTCVECAENSDCTGATPICAGGDCVECAANTDCSGDSDTCTAGVCRCGSGPACSGGTPVCDTGTCRAPVWANLTTFGSQGTDASQFRSPYSVAVSANGLTALIADFGNYRVSVWTRQDAASTTWTNQTTFGTQGADASQFNGSYGIFVSADGLTAWIADTGNNRVSVWTRPGTTGSDATNWTNQTTFGTQGAGAAQFSGLRNVFVSADGLTAWIADQNNSRISVWTRPGTTGSDATNWTNQTTFGSNGASPSQFNGPRGVAVSADGLTAWIADRYNHRISVWTRPGTTGSDATNWTNQTTFGSEGAGPSQFSNPFGVFVSVDGLTVWIPDSSNRRISVWSRPGTTGSDATNWTNQTTFGTGPGSGPEEFNGPSGVVASAAGLTAWIADQNNNRISIWTYS